MAVFRLFLLVTILGGLTLLLVQNWSPVLPLVFLGMQTQSLPLAMWILFSITAGAATSVLISSLFQISNYFTAPKRQARSPSPPPRTSPSNNRPSGEEFTYRPPREEPKYTYTTPSASASKTSEDTYVDDWETEGSDDWDFVEKPKEAPRPPQNTQFQDSNVYERQEKSTSNYQSDSSYSYNYREPKNSGVGKTESVYDADYRVIIPPYQPSAETQINEPEQADEDDWSFLDEDNDDENEKSRR